MAIEQEASNLSNDTSTGAVDLITVKRQIKTSVIVDDGRLIVLGGLIDEDLRQGVSKVPVLGDLPLLPGAEVRPPASDPSPPADTTSR